LMMRPMAIAATTALLLGSTGLADEPKARTRPDAPELAPEPGYKPKPGDRVTLYSVTKEGKPSTAWLAADRHDFRDFTKALNIRDRDEVREMRRDGRVIELDSGAGILVTDVDQVRYGAAEFDVSTMLTVRILDGPKKGRKLCIPEYFAARLIPKVTHSEAERAEKVADADRARAARDRARAEAIETADNAQIARDRARAEAAAKARAESLMLASKNLEKAGKAKAALENYRKVVAEFGDTPSAKPAAERIKALAGKAP
jgi:hypothetical protein